MKYTEVVCKVCKKTFNVMSWKLGQGRGKTCSVECRRELQKKSVTGSASKKWKGGEFLRNGYRYILEPEHPLANTNGYIAEHRKVLTDKLGRTLRKGRKNMEVAHHINGNKLDNRPKNLVALSQSEHQTRHQTLNTSCLCGEKSKRNGMCDKHYMRFWRHKTVEFN